MTSAPRSIHESGSELKVGFRIGDRLLFPELAQFGRVGKFGEDFIGRRV